MKNFFLALSIALFLSFFNFINCNISYCENTNVPKNDILYNYLYEDIDRISSRIYLLSKNVIIDNKSFDESKKQEFFKDIKYITNDISSLIYTIQNNYKQYENDKNTLNGLYVMTLMLEEYRFALTQLESYISSINSEERYSTLQSFFIINTEANRKLNSAKSFIPK